MIGFYNYTVILTYISLLISSVGIGLAAAGRPFEALCCLLASGVCDMFDGKIARTRKKSTEEEKRFGIQIDSLCDVICFGVLPASVGISLASQAPALDRGVVWALSALYILCALIRLAYFNVTEETRQATESGRRTYFIGVPVTTAAVVFPLVYALSLLLPAPIAPWLYPAFILITAVVFITPVRVRKPHSVGLVILGLIGLLEAALMFYLLLR
ncbi:MAG: CDP-alcohol phosphatidyltransferase family protein [Clostridia bacterium]|nr:CDP-alcohol phosphatidyltransferase family protein [Clostridia bacterium]